MKKVFAICLALVMVFALSTTAFAAPDNFVESPTGNGPVIDDFESDDPNFSGSLVIIPFKDRGELSTDDQQAMEDAYNSLTKADDLSNVCAGLKDVADSMNIPTQNLAIKDLFNIDAVGGGVTVDGGKFTVKLDASTIKGFVGIMQYIDGQWILISDAVIKDGKLIFTTEELTTYAIVVDATKGATTSPQTGDVLGQSVIALSAVSLMAVVVAVLLVLKKKAV